MSTPIFAEDSSVVILAPNLLKTVENLDENADKFDHIMAFFITVMAESGYRVSCLYDENTKTWSKEMTCIPENWKIPGTNTYEINFILYKIRDVRCKLICNPIGDWLVVNLLPRNASAFCKAKSMTVNVAKYVNMHMKELGKFWHLKELALRFKNDLLAPLHGEMMMEIGVAGPCLQGLPQELKVFIANMLDKKSRRNLEEICKDFSNSSSNVPRMSAHISGNHTRLMDKCV